MTATAEPRRIRASSMPRAMKCPASIDYPQIGQWNAAADLGTAVHRAAAAIVQNEDVNTRAIAQQYGVDYDDVDGLAASAAAMWKRMAEWMPEPVAELSLETAIPEANVIVSGTPDLFSVTESANGVVIRVVDWKSGWVDGDYSAQIITYAWLASLQQQEDIAAAWTGIAWLRWGEVEGFDVEPDLLRHGWQARIAEISQRAARGERSVGPQCRYCPGVHLCPALAQMARVVESEDLTDENAYQAYCVGNALATASSRIRDGLKAFLSTRPGGVPAEPGKRLALVEKPRAEIVTEKAFEWLMDRFPETYLEPVRISRGKINTLIRRACKGTGKRVGDEIDLATAELRELGALRQSTHEEIALVKEPEAPTQTLQEENDGTTTDETTRTTPGQTDAE